MFVARIKRYSILVGSTLETLLNLTSPISEETRKKIFDNLDEIKELERQLIADATPEQERQIPAFAAWLKVRKSLVEPSCETSAGREAQRDYIATAGALADAGTKL